MYERTIRFYFKKIPKSTKTVFQILTLIHLSLHNTRLTDLQNRQIIIKLSENEERQSVPSERKRYILAIHMK